MVILYIEDTAQNVTKRSCKQNRVKGHSLKHLRQVGDPYVCGCKVGVCWSLLNMNDAGSSSLFNRFNMKKRVQQTAKG